MQGLSAGHAIVEGIIFAARRQSARHLAHNLNDLPHDITAVTAGGPLEQIPDRCADFCLCVFGVGEFPTAFTAQSPPAITALP
jgi:hypothetical protein